jgi:hypothetical protein
MKNSAINHKIIKAIVLVIAFFVMMSIIGCHGVEEEVPEPVTTEYDCSEFQYILDSLEGENLRLVNKVDSLEFRLTQSKQ